MSLKVPYIKSFCRIKKMSWINKLLDPLNVAVLESLLRCKDGEGIIVYASIGALIHSIQPLKYI